VKLKNFLYLSQLEEYDPARIIKWLNQNPNREVVEIKKKLIWTAKARCLYFIATVLFFMPPEKSVIFAINFLKPFDSITKSIIVFLATLKLKILHRRLKIIAITGSWGKTTAKDKIVTLLSHQYRTQSTIANQNTILGISFRVLKLPLNTQYFVVEIGAYYPGDIAAVCKILHPQIGIITAIGPMHLERFGSLENIFKTKMELAQSITNPGTIFLPVTIKTQIKSISLKCKNILFFENLDYVYQQLGRLLMVNQEHINQTVTTQSPSSHRLEIIKNGTMTIIDDSYNSNPVGFKIALQKLKSIESKNRILITPGMIELGNLQDRENTKAAAQAATVCDHLIIVGQTNRSSLKSGALSAKTKVKIHLVDSIAQAQQLLPQLTTANTAVLFENDLADNFF